MYNLLSNSSIHFDDILEVVCKNRKVSKKDILNVDDLSLSLYLNLKNINKAIKLFKKLKDKVKIGIVVDPDPDGYTSSSVLYMYIKKNFPNVKMQVFFQEGKQHGITNKILTNVLESDIGLLIVPDAGTNDFEEHEVLNHFGIPFIVLDHHEAKKESEFGIIVNSQLSKKYTNKQLSGVGIVYQFLRGLDNEFNLNDADNYLDLVSLGNIADAMEMTSLETRYLVYEGFKQIKNEWLKDMIYKNIGSYSKLSPTSYSFNLIPKMNATIRVGSQEQKEQLFYAMIGKQETFYNSRARGENKNETLQFKATREASLLHGKQKKIKNELISRIKQKIESENLNEEVVIIVKFNKDEEFNKNLTGNAAQTISDIYKKPTFVLHEFYNKKEDKTEYRGSYRGVNKVCNDTKRLLEKINVCNYVEGHSQAGGIGIDEDHLELLRKGFDKRIDLNDSIGIDVDFKIKQKDIKISLLKELQSLEKYWGKGIEAPKFYVEEIVINTNNCKITDGGMFSYSNAGINFVQFVVDNRFKQLINEKKQLTVNAICKLNVNEFMGKTSYQCLLEDFEIVKIEDSKKASGFIW